mmetsp:Transcript_28214/g.43050  ORF Transcript_28214/g.43050 Transcript_28214/m.43050 type:complete len:86 (-) Transcript_28214:134-391(-)
MEAKTRRGPSKGYNNPLGWKGRPNSDNISSSDKAIRQKGQIGGFVLPEASWFSIHWVMQLWQLSCEHRDSNTMEEAGVSLQHNAQ